MWAGLKVLGSLARGKSDLYAAFAPCPMSWFCHLVPLVGVREKVWTPKSLDNGMLMAKEERKYQ